ncbi:MAG: hypothetical protein NC926_00375 [Candidatus Omnitrophica bacterium]|nr:hypothetical protein [Candidatus Omnitrophota bacterium]MCM8806405.1 hypothetical protein [Candidatus Omnitrophota bacterium]
MEFEVGYMLSLIIVGLSFLGFFLSMMIDEVNRKKAVVIFILSLILFGLGVYYYYVVGLWQKESGGPSVNKLNYYLHVYRPENQTEIPVLPFQMEK